MLLRKTDALKTLIKTRRDRKREIPNTVLEKRTLCFSSYKNRRLSSWKKRWHFIYRLFCPKEIFFLTFVYGILNTLLEYTYFYKSKNITSYYFCFFTSYKILVQGFFKGFDLNYKQALFCCSVKLVSHVVFTIWSNK